MDERMVVSIRMPKIVGDLWKNRDRAGRWLGRQMVPNLGTLLLVGILLWVSGVYAAPDSVPLAQTANTSLTTVNYQGRLADNLGTPINDTVSLTFAMYETESGGTAIWSENHGAVPVSDGLFSVRMGQITPLSADLLAENLWLEIQVDTDPPMTPREKLAAVPYAMQALTVPDGSITAEKIADGSVSQDEAPFAPLTYWYAIDDIPDPNMKIAIITSVFNPGGSTNRNFDISTYGFTTRPLGICEISDTTTTVARYFCAYSWDGSDTSTAHIRLYSYDGSASGPSGNIRITLFLMGK